MKNQSAAVVTHRIIKGIYHNGRIGAEKKNKRKSASEKLAPATNIILSAALGRCP